MVNILKKRLFIAYENVWSQFSDKYHSNNIFVDYDKIRFFWMSFVIEIFFLEISQFYKMLWY